MQFQEVHIKNILKDGKILIRGLLLTDPSLIKMRLLVALPNNHVGGQYEPHRIGVLSADCNLPLQEPVECTLQVYDSYGGVHGDHFDMIHRAKWNPENPSDYLILRASDNSSIDRKHPIVLQLLSYLLSYLHFHIQSTGPERFAAIQMGKKLSGFILRANKKNEDIFVPFR